MLPHLVASLLAGETAVAIRRLKSALVVYAFCAVLLFLAIIFALLAGYVAAAREFGQITAALGFAGVFLAIAAIVYAIHRLQAAAAARRATRRRRTEVGTLTGIAAAAALPVVLSGRWRILGLLAPAAAAAAYAIYKDHQAQRRRRPRLPEDDPEDDYE